MRISIEALQLLLTRKSQQELPFASARFGMLDKEKNQVAQITKCSLPNLKKQDWDSHDDRHGDFDKWTAKA